MHWSTNSSSQLAIPADDLFVRRWGHSAVRVDDYVYLDGGYVTSTKNHDTSDQIIHNVDRTLSIPLFSSWTNQSVNIIQSPPGDRPEHWGSILWPRSNGFYLYGGTNGRKTINTVWQFLADGKGGGIWAKSPDPSAPVLSGLQDSSCSSLNHAGFCYGGYRSYFTDYFTGFPLPGIISYNWTSDSWRNETTPAPKSTVLGGAAETISDLGPEGIMVFLGGARHPNGPIDLESAHGNPVSMASISIYEPLSNKWYQQPTTGPTPPSRVSFCTSLAKSSTGSYELFIYGGGEAALATGGRTFSYDDVYVLTIPGFNWFQVPQVDENNPGGRALHTCTLVGNRQVLVVGGFNWQNLTSQYRSVDPWTQGIGIFDLSTLSWKDSYDAHAHAYESPKVITEWYQNGNLDRVDWSSSELRALFQVDQASPISSSSDSPDVGAITGGAVGGVLGLLLVLLLLWTWFRRRRGLPILGRDRSDISTTDEPVHEFEHKYEDKPELPASHSTPDLAHPEQDAKGPSMGHDLLAYDSNAPLRLVDLRHELE